MKRKIKETNEPYRLLVLMNIKNILYVEISAVLKSVFVTITE